MLAVTIRSSLLESVSAAKRERRGDDVVIRVGEGIIAAAKVQGNTKCYENEPRFNGVDLINN